MNQDPQYATPAASGWKTEEVLATQYEPPTPQARLAEALLDLLVSKLDISAASVASHLVDAVCETLDTDEIERRVASGIDAYDIAQFVETSEIADALDLDAEELAGYINVSAREIARSLMQEQDDRYAIAQEIDLDDLVEKLDLAEISTRVLAALQVPALDGSNLVDDLADIDAAHTSVLDIEERLVQAEARIEALTGALRTAVECIARAIEVLA